MDHCLVMAKGFAQLNEVMSHVVQEHPRQVTVKNSNKTWSTEGGNGESLQYSCLENPINSMKKQKDRTPEDEPPRLEDVQYATGEEQRNSSRKNEVAGPKWK